MDDDVIAAAHRTGPVATEDLSDFDPSLPARFVDESIFDYFKRLRAESPVHYTPESSAGPFWSLTRHADIMAVDMNHQVYSSDVKYGGISLLNADPEMVLPMFIAQDPQIPSRQSCSKAIGSWSEGDIASYLETGFTPDFDSVGGSMVDVQQNIAHLPASDREAIAAYLKAVPAR